MGSFAAITVVVPEIWTPYPPAGQPPFISYPIVGPPSEPPVELLSGELGTMWGIKFRSNPVGDTVFDTSRGIPIPQMQRTDRLSTSGSGWGFVSYKVTFPQKAPPSDGFYRMQISPALWDEIKQDFSPELAAEVATQEVPAVTLVYPEMRPDKVTS